MAENTFKMIISGALLGAIGGAAASIFKQPAPKKKRINYKKDLYFAPQFFKFDVECAESFLALQHYRYCSENDFDMAGDATDSLFSILSSYQEGKISADSEQKYINEANNCYRIIVERLDYFKDESKRHLITNTQRYYKQADESEVKEIRSKFERGKSAFIDVSKLVDEIKDRVKGHVNSFYDYQESYQPFEDFQSEDSPRHQQQGDDNDN